MKIPFTKAHGARNDFLLTWREELPEGIQDSAEAAFIRVPGKLATQSWQRLSDFVSRLIRGQFQTRHEGLSPGVGTLSLVAVDRDAVFCLVPWCPQTSLAVGVIMRAGCCRGKARRLDSAFSRAAPRAAAAPRRR